MNGFANPKRSIKLEDVKQWNKLKEICSDNKVRIVKYGQEDFVYPKMCILLSIAATGQGMICPTDDNEANCVSRGYNIITLDEYKESIK